MWSLSKGEAASKRVKQDSATGREKGQPKGVSARAGDRNQVIEEFATKGR